MRRLSGCPDKSAREARDEGLGARGAREPPVMAALGTGPVKLWRRGLVAPGGRALGRDRHYQGRPGGADRHHQDRNRSGAATGQTQQRKEQPLWVGPLRAAVEQRHGVMIATPLGTLHDPLPTGLVDQLEALVAAAPVIVDLSQITLVAPAPVMGLAAWLVGASHHPDRCCLVCPRATARALLRKWHITRCLATFGSIGDALQARRFHVEGYGAGWHPAPSPGARSESRPTD
jgi:hypothetical protein